ncbi:UDP-glycosyltransferase protein [Vigna angularis]|uniref:UDP-glycosyltransferase protein n=1 Tax=Phaseolus angularis TaxID=3914 RepID=A0A8T0L0K0_PHAAN|nr:B3 domain-containing transcription factor VRN1 [Vigna angularis]KAG2405161.1 UDP-glycosyltransferase protein [Vigna angularis]
MFIHKHNKDDEDHGVVEATSEECIKWLDDKEKRLVVYVSFRSMGVLDEKQIDEVAYGLRDCGRYFLWVVKGFFWVKLPAKFVSKYGNHLPNTMFLKLPNDAEWEVKLEKSDGSVWFQQGWKEFVEYHCLAHGHLLVFRYNGTSHFHVLICDMSCMEIDYPVNKANHKRVRIKSENIQPPKTKKTTENKKRCCSNLQDTASDELVRDHKGMLKNLNEGKRNMEALENTFMVIMKPTFFTTGYMYLPRAAVRSQNKRREEFVTLVVGDRRWRVKLVRYPNDSAYFTNLLDFARDNNLKEGDACFFKLMNMGDNMVIKVSFVARNSSLRGQ